MHSLHLVLLVHYKVMPAFWINVKKNAMDIDGTAQNWTSMSPRSSEVCGINNYCFGPTYNKHGSENNCVRTNALLSMHYKKLKYFGKFLQKMNNYTIFVFIFKFLCPII